MKKSTSDSGLKLVAEYFVSWDQMSCLEGSDNVRVLLGDGSVVRSANLLSVLASRTSRSGGNGAVME